MTSPYPDPGAAPSFVTPDDLLRGAAAEVANYYANDRDYLADVCRTASEGVEEMCGGRRLLPFYDLVESDVLTGVNPDGGGLDGGEFALGLQGALGLSEARAFGYQHLVRDLWVGHYPPHRQELWEYTAVSVALSRPWGDRVVLDRAGFDGPTLDTGHIQLRLGTLAPVGTQYEVTYSGGYTLGTPTALREAARWDAIRRLILDSEPELRPGLSLDAVDATIARHLAPYAGRTRDRRDR